MKCHRLLFGGTVWGLLGCGALANDEHGGGGSDKMCMTVAQTEIPKCAQMCFMRGAPDIGCSGTDFACQCAQQAGMMAAIEGCVKDGCPSAKYQAVIDGSQAVCNCVKTCKSSAPGAASASGLASGMGSAMGSATAAGSFKSSAPTPAATSSSSPNMSPSAASTSPCLTVTVTMLPTPAGTNKTSTPPAVASTSSTAPPAIVTAAATGSQAPIGLVAGLAFAVALL